MKIFTLLHNSNIVGTVLPGLKSRITSTRPVLALLLLLMVGGWNSVAWGADCTYNFTKNEERTSIHNGETIYRATINGNYYGLSSLSFHIEFSQTLYLDNRSKDLAYDIYLYNNSTKSWSKRESKSLAGYGVGTEGATITYTTDLTNITAFKVVSTTNFGQYSTIEWFKTKYYDVNRTVAISGVTFQMASTISADVSSINFGSVTYGSSKSENVTASYTLNYDGDMTASCTGDYSATVSSASCGCSTSQQSKTITVTFTPTQAGTRNDTLTIKNPNGTSTTVDLTGFCNRANPTLNMSNGSVNVTTDKANPVELDLAGLKASGTPTGIGAFDSFVLQSADASTGAKAEGVTISGSKFSSTVGGKYTVRATTKQNNQYNSTYKDFTVTVNRLTQTISWTPANLETEPFVEEDVVTATSIGDVTLEKSGAGAEYVTIDGNTATVGEVETNSSVTLTATAAQTDVYAQATDSKTITLTSLQKQHITFEQNLTKLKTTDGTKKVELVATSDSGRDSYITFAVDANTAGVSVTHEGDKWYLNYTGTAVKGIAVTASLAGVEGVSVAASDVSQMVKVTDPNAKCDITETLATAYGIKSTDKVYDLTIPKEVVLKVRCSEKSRALIMGYDIKFYNAQNQQVGSTQSFGGWDTDQYNTQDVKTRTFSNLDKNITKLVFTSNASKGYDITEASYERWSYATPSKSALTFETQALSTVADQEFTLSYANYQIELSIEGSSNFVIKSEDSFGDCETYGSKTVKVGYNVPAVKCEESATLYIKDNAGNTLNTVTLNANVLGGLTQNITSTNIKTSYLTTDSAHLSATTDRGLKNFTYSASPAGVASFDGNVMTFSQSGTIAITVTEAGNATFNEATATVKNVVVSKATPDIANLPTGTEIPYRSTLNASTLSGGSATITLRNVEGTPVAGSYAWTEPTHVVMDAAGSHSYAVTFNPMNTGMYNPNTTGSISINITRAEQSLAMNNGTVKVAVDGIDAGAADSKLDLDDLIKSQTQDPVEASRAGVVTYEVISENKANATIAEGNIFSATVIGDYTIRAVKAETDYYSLVADTFVVTVSKRANTMVIAETEYEQFVDDEVSNIRDLQNSDATVQTSSDFPTIASYDIANNKIVIPNRESNYQMFGSQKTVTIKIWQDETERFEALDTLTITLTVKKYETTKSGEDIVLKVNETVTGNYSFTNTSADYPSNDLNDDFYYTIDAPSFDNEALNNGSELITYNPATKQISGYNAGTTKITFFQKETYKYTGATLMCNIAVEKRTNQINNSWSNVWQKAMSENGAENISFTSTHGDYANYPIVIEQIYGEDVATLTGDAAGATITTNTTKGYAIWHLSQAENYEYYPAEADVMVMVGVPAPPTCYVYEDMNNEHEFMTHITDAEGHYETPIAINAPIDKIWYSARRQTGGYNYFVVQYSTDNAKTWSAFSTPDLGTKYGNYSATFPTMSDGKRITHVRFGAKTGATLHKYYKDVRISRKAYMNIQDAEKKKISKLPTMMCTIDESSSAEAKFYIDYSTCADEIIIESSNPEHFTVSRTSIDVSENHDNSSSTTKEEITVTYKSTELGTHNAVITVRTSYQTCALSVSGETTKRTPTLTWQEGYTNNPLTLPVGLTVNAIKPAATTTSTALIMYESSDESVVKIIEDGYAFKVVGAGTATLTATVPENDKWKSVNDTRIIQATEKVVQEIVWDQIFPRFMKPNDVIDLDAKVFLRNLSTSALTYSEERSQQITYSCPHNNGIVSISGNKMTILNYGEAKIWASVGGNDDYEAAASVTVLINVRQPSDGCETPLVFHKEEAIDMFEVNIDFSNYANLTTQEMVSDEFLIDPAYGKPDKLSFQYEGEEFKILNLKYFGGFIKFEQRVNSQWLPVENSRVETVKNEWKTKSDLQLDVNADALRIIRESGATGHHYIKDIQVTRKQYLRETQNEINLGEITMGQATPVTIGFEYSDVKGDLTARTINNTTDVTIKNNGAIDIECGSLGHYDLPVTFTPSQVGDWEGTIEVYDNIANLSITIHLTATVKANEEYIFNQEGDWNINTSWTTNLVPDENADITVAKDMVINSPASVKSITIEEGVTVTVKSGKTLVIGDGSPKDRDTYGNLYVEDGGQVILNGGELRINDFKLDASLGSATEDTNTPASSGQVSGESNLRVDGDAYFQVSFDPAGAITFGWYDFTVPFEVDALNGVFDKDGNKLTYNVDYAIMEYSEAKRAAKAARAWTWFSGTLQPGKLYTITFDDEKNWNTFIFKKKPHVLYTETKTFAAVCSPSGDAQDRGWNGMGNGSLQHRQLDLSGDAKIQIEDHANKCYVVRDAADYTYAVGTAFFVQVGEPKNIDLIAATGDRGFLAPARNGRSVNEFRLAFAADGQETKADHIWVSASEEATGEYVIGHDLLKMGTPTEAKVAQVWATRDNMTLCDIEMPLVANKAATAISLFAPSAGIYTLSTEKMPEDATLYLTKNGKVIWNLSMSPYEFDLTQGTTEGYGLRIVANSNSATGIEGADSEGETIRKVLIDDMIYIIAPNGSMYNVTGKIVK